MHLLWSQTVPTPLRGLSLARECETILVWDGQEELVLFDHAGKIQAQRPSPAPIAAACCAEDGSVYAIACVGERSGASTIAGRVCCLGPDLAPRWQCSLQQRPTALALEPLGQRLAVADASGTVIVMDARGQTIWQATTLRPLHYLAFVPEKPILIGAADFGLVLCLSVSGECLWRDGLVAHVGSLAVSGDGDSLLLACFSDGLVRYRAGGPEHERVPLETACSLAALSYDADCMLTADRRNRLCLRDDKGGLRDQTSLDVPAVALALGAMADFAVVGLANGAVLCVADRPA